MKHSVARLCALLFSALSATAAPLAKRQTPAYVLTFDNVASCWGTTDATFVANMHISVNGQQPMGDANGGLANLQVKFNGATTVQVGQSWNGANPKATGNVFSFQTQDDQPVVGGQFTLAGIACNNGKFASGVTVSASGALITGGAISVTVQNGAIGGGAQGQAGTPAAPTPAAPSPAATSPAATPPPAAMPDMACVVTLPANALSATGLSTPWVVSGNGCTQAADGKPTFAECTIVDTATGKLSVYSPLMINKGQAFVKPVVPALTATSVVGCWFGTNGASTTIADGTNGKDLAAANCVNGDPNTKGDIFGQFAACNAAQFFAAANKATLTIPALGTGKNGKTCYTTRSFEVVDMDQSDNVITTYSLDANGKIGQKTTANSQTLTTDINNGSDNLLLDAFLRPAIGCTAFTVPSLADPAMSFGSLALNELQAAKFQQAPVAQVPPNNPMVVNAAGNPSKTKQNAYRAAVNQAAGAGTTAESTAYCQSFLDVSAASIITDSKFTIGFASPDTGAGSNLYTFLGQRHAASWAGLGCDTLLPNVAYLDPNQKLPIIANTDANGVTTSLTFNTQTLLNLAKANGLATGTTPAPAPTPAAGTPPAAQPTKTAGTPAATPAPAPATAGAPNYDFVWDISACYPSGGAQNIFQLNIKASVNGDQPAADANGGLAALQITFGGLASIGISNTWASANSKATGNVWSFETIDDGPNIGGQFLLPAGVACVGQMPATVPTLSMTGKLLTGGPINAVIRPKGAPAGQGATVPVPAPPPATPAPAPTPAPTPAPAPTPTPAPATGGGLPYVFNYKFDNCWGNTGAVFFPLRMTLSVNGHQPMDDADGGLAAISMTFGGLQNVMISNTWSIGNAMTTGNTLKFETQDDAPNPGGIFQTSDPAVSCQNGKMSVTPTLTASGALLNGGAIAITLNQTA